MGKGGRTDATVKQQAADKAAGLNVWKSSYNPLDPNAPEIPTKGALKAAIPAHCFERSYLRSFGSTIRDVIMAVGFAYGTSLVMSTDLPSLSDPAAVALYVAGWGFYAFWQGTILTGLWVVAHECGHGAFSPSQTVNDIVGFVLHQFLLVPYFAWQYSHAKHHRRTNHLTDGESHVPGLGRDNGLGPNNERLFFYAKWHEAMGDEAFALFQVWTHLCIGWPLYLLGVASTGKVDLKGEPLNGRVMDHFRPWSPMFPAKLAPKILLSTVTTIFSLVAIVKACMHFGFVPVYCWYLGPYFVANGWLVLYTWLQHTDPSVPHYGEGEWTWVKGALTTIDRDYGIFDFFHHRIGSTHLAHHLFHELPHYNAKEATQALKEYLAPTGLYNYDPTPWWQAMWRIAHTCHYVDESSGIQYYKSLEDVPLSKAAKKLD
eukprot:Nitzschia sp. Nitz4//scaffold120_size68122//45775//47064//NITZ4_006051-RA/size68122-processed-gene-0.50-mRNA-1//-1//CDS//3329534299//1228//frame0